MIGSILLAGATSLPELMVDIRAVLLKQPDLGVGDLLGSSLFNLFILALIDSCFRHPRRAFTNEFSSHAQTAVLSINLTALVGVGILARLPIAFAGIGLFSWIVAIVYLLGMMLIFESQAHFPANTNVSSLKEHAKRRTLVKTLIGFLISGTVILIAAPYLVHSADRIATLTGLGHTFVGTTLVVLSTSLPELVTTIAAFRMGTPDLALGNIFGSNTFNMLLILPLDAFYPTPLLNSVSPVHTLTAFCVITVASVAVLGQISGKREKPHIWEPSSELIILLTLAFFYLLYWVRDATLLSP